MRTRVGRDSHIWDYPTHQWAERFRDAPLVGAPRFPKKGELFDLCIKKDPNGCWLFEVDPGGNYEGINPQRVSWVLYGKGEIGARQIVTTCGDESCVNPKHLEAVT